VVWGAAIALVGVVGSLWPAAVLLAVAGAADSVSAVCRSSINQMVTPDAMRGRMSSVFSLVVTSGPRLGDVESGTVAGLTSPRFSVTSGGLACIAGVAVVVAAFPALARFDAEEVLAAQARARPHRHPPREGRWAMIFRQITHDDLGCASYLVGDDDAAVAAVIDPRLDIDEYLRLARYLGARIEHVLETHNHADHVSGHGRLAASTGATIHIHRAARPSTTTRPSTTAGSSRSEGSWCARCTPRPPARAHRLRAHRHRARSRAVGGAHRRLALRRRHRAARPRRRSARGRARHLPLAARPPAHAARHVRGVARAPRRLDVRRPGIDLKVSSTIGYERAHQEVLGVVDEEEFVERAVAGLGPQPPNFRAIVAINTGPLGRRTRTVDPLTPRQVEQHQRDGAMVVDVRTELQFDDAHIPGAICITVLRAGFGSRLAWLADHDQPVVVVGRDDDDACGAIALAASVGVTNVAGYLAGGMTSWREDQLAVARIPRMTVPELHERWADGRRCRCSTCASSASGSAGTSRARSTCPTTTSTPAGRHRRRRPRSPSSARRVSAPLWAPACWPATARAR
jgi:rhodanese-related sulfurtransferase